jgi:hypothetical protein
MSTVCTKARILVYKLNGIPSFPVVKLVIIIHNLSGRVVFNFMWKVAVLRQLMC